MASELSKLHIFVTNQFDHEELRTLCFYLDVDYHDLDGERKSARARELILLMARQRRLDELLGVLQRCNPAAFASTGLSLEAAWLEQLYEDYARFAAANWEMPPADKPGEKTFTLEPTGMVEAASIPTLAKAVESLFVDCREILGARSGRHEPQQTAGDKTSGESFEVETIESAEEALAGLVDEQLWLVHSAEVEHLLNLLKIHLSNYYLASEQKAILGHALVPQHILHNLREAQEGIEQTARKLLTRLDKLFGKHLDIGA